MTYRFAMARTLRLPAAAGLCCATAIVLLVIGQPMAAAGVAIGFGLFLLNAVFLWEAGRSLLSSGRARGGGMLAGLSSSVRLLLLAVCLAGVFIGLGRAAGLGACGGLFLSQVNLHRPRLPSRR